VIFFRCSGFFFFVNLDEKLFCTVVLDDRELLVFRV
jgi:hypothetical protein